MDLSGLFAEMTGPSMAMASALALTAGAYANAKLGISSDVSTMMGNRAAMNRLQQRIGQLGDTPTIYKMLERVVDVDKHGATEALWFEHKTWTYAQLKDCMLSCPNSDIVKLTVVLFFPLRSGRSYGSFTPCARISVRRCGERIHDQLA